MAMFARDDFEAIFIIIGTANFLKETI